MSILRTVARPLLAAPFIAAGADALLRPQAHRERAERLAPIASKVGVDLDETTSDSAARGLGAAFTVAGIGLATGKFPRVAAAALAALEVPVALANNPVWRSKGKDRLADLSGLLGAAGLVGGALLAAGDRDGKPSLSWRRQANRRHKKALKAARASQSQ